MIPLLIHTLYIDFVQGLTLRASSPVLSTASFPGTYHTAEQLLAEIRVIANTCMHEISADLDGLVPWVQIGPRSGRRSFVLAGEHARELVPSEVALSLIKTLCKQEILDQAWLVVPLANRGGRAKVEAGNFCWRANAGGVDLNRNWSGHVGNFRSSRETYGGPEAFSEAETRSLRDLVAKWNPEIFFSVHSGSEAVLVPWAAEGGKEISDRQQAKLQAAEPWRRRLCPRCAAGEALEVLRYESPGTCLDWTMKNLKSLKVALALEVYQGPEAAECKEFFNPDTPSDVAGRWTELILGVVSSN